MDLKRVQDGSKCPKCSYIGRVFLGVSENFLVCLDCGCVFIGKGRRDELKKLVKDKASEIKVEPLVGSFKCDECDFIAKTEYGLVVHKRKHARAD